MLKELLKLYKQVGVEDIDSEENSNQSSESNHTGEQIINALRQESKKILGEFEQLVSANDAVVSDLSNFGSMVVKCSFPFSE